MLPQTPELYERVLGKEHPGALETMDVLVTTLFDVGRYEEAERMCRLTLEKRGIGKEL
ncbi:hypothetical protein GGI42DRAFT_337572 [Trichoderma sp. SZMC 28013]